MTHEEVATTRSERGFLQFDDPVLTDYGHTVKVFESSAALRGPMAWMSIVKAESRGDGDLPTCNIGVHMSLDQVIAIRDRLNAFITAAQAGDTCELIDE